MSFADELEKNTAEHILADIDERSAVEVIEKKRLLFLDATDDDLQEYAQRRASDRQASDSVENYVAKFKRLREMAKTPDQWQKNWLER